MLVSALNNQNAIRNEAACVIHHLETRSKWVALVPQTLMLTSARTEPFAVILLALYLLMCWESSASLTGSMHRAKKESIPLQAATS